MIKSSIFVDSRPQTLTWTINIAQVLGFALLTALAAKAQFYLSFSPVPITLQSFVVLLSGAVLGSRKGALSQLSLIGLGASGLPVFSLPLPGIAVLMGPTGGYIFGFVMAAFLMGRLVESGATKSFGGMLGAIGMAKLSLFLPGLLWLSWFVPGGIQAVLLAGFWPFIPGAIVKSFLLLGFLKGLEKVRR
jgi:biotin transport system substrate-specific component